MQHNRFQALYHTRLKLLLILLSAGMIATADASAYLFYSSGNTATVHSPDVRLVAGPDASGSCTVYPCAAVTGGSRNDVATVSISFFAADPSNLPVPSTYYTDLLLINNAGTASHSIESIQITNVAGTTSDLGSITVHYCPTQTEFSPNGAPITSCIGSFAITSSAGGYVSGTFPQAIAKDTYQCIEIVAYAASTARSGSITFNIVVQSN